MTNRPVSPGEARVELARLLRDAAEDVLRSPLPVWILAAGNSFDGHTTVEREQAQAIRLLAEATTAVSHLAGGLAHEGTEDMARQLLKFGVMGLQARNIRHLADCEHHHGVAPRD